jgi:hypothetical protein
MLPRGIHGRSQITLACTSSVKMVMPKSARSRSARHAASIGIRTVVVGPPVPARLSEPCQKKNCRLLVTVEQTVELKHNSTRLFVELVAQHLTPHANQSYRQSTALSVTRCL